MATAIVCGGCGGTGTPQASIPGSALQTRAQAAKPLAAAIYASCGTSTFAAPAVSPTSAGFPPTGWQVVYQYPPQAPRRPRPGQTTIVTIVERAPFGQPAKIAGAREITVAGRKVSLYDRTRTTMYVARWRTGKASYETLADGDAPATLERLIACLP